MEVASNQKDVPPISGHLILQGFLDKAGFSIRKPDEIRIFEAENSIFPILPNFCDPQPTKAGLAFSES